VQRGENVKIRGRKRWRVGKSRSRMNEDGMGIQKERGFRWRQRQLVETNM
jgi:hypothetical protein